jgi:DNA-binding NarL/FixJ family response regulator
VNQPSGVTEEHIAAARLRIVLDGKLGRVTPAEVRRIASMSSPEHPVPHDEPERPNVSEVTLDPARAPVVPIRSIAGTLARDSGLADESREEIESAVDATYSALAALARPGSAVQWSFTIAEDSVRIVAEVDSAETVVESGSWSAISDLTDGFSVTSDGLRVHVEMKKHRPRTVVTSPADTTPLRILVADDHPMYRAGLLALLGAEPDMQVVGEASTTAEVVSAVSALTPDVIVLDPNMGDETGGDAVRRVLDVRPSAAILILTMFQGEELSFAAIRAGARGHLTKDASPVDIISAVHAVGEGESVLSPELARRIMGGPHTPTKLTTAESALPQLSEREREVLKLIASGTSAAEIGRALSLSPRTVRNYISSIFTKLQLSDRTQAVAHARGAGQGDQVGKDAPGSREPH